MSLNWQWKECKGWVENRFSKMNPEWKYRVYHGNALMIVLAENDNEKTWQMDCFFVDAEHGKRCLKDNIFEGKNYEFHLLKDRSNKKLAKLLTEYYINVIWEDTIDDESRL